MQSRYWTVRRKVLGAIVAVAAVGAIGAVSAGQNRALRDLMQLKQAHAREVLDAVVTNDWLTLEQRSRDLLSIAEDPAWAPLTTPEYAQYSSAFLRAARDLLEAAMAHDQAAAPLAYVSLTLSCVQCHHHVGQTPLATLGLPGSVGR